MSKKSAGVPRKEEAAIEAPAKTRKAPSGTFIRMTSVVDGKSVGQIKLKEKSDLLAIANSPMSMDEWIMSAKERLKFDRQVAKKQREIEKAEKELKEKADKLAVLKGAA